MWHLHGIIKDIGVETCFEKFMEIMQWKFYHFNSFWNILCTLIFLLIDLHCQLGFLIWHIVDLHLTYRAENLIPLQMLKQKLLVPEKCRCNAGFYIFISLLSSISINNLSKYTACISPFSPLTFSSQLCVF